MRIMFLPPFDSIGSSPVVALFPRLHPLYPLVHRERLQTIPSLFTIPPYGISYINPYLRICQEEVLLNILFSLLTILRQCP